MKISSAIMAVILPSCRPCGHYWDCHTVALSCCSLQWRHNERDGVSNHQPHDCLLNDLFSRRSKTPKLRATGLCVGNSPVTCEFPIQRASNAENVSIWWRHHVKSPLLIWRSDDTKFVPVIPDLQTTVRCRYNAVNFHTNIHKRQHMECLLWIQHVIHILPQFLQSFMQNLTITYRVITALENIHNDLNNKNQIKFRQDCKKIT